MYNFSVDCAVDVCKYMESIAFGSPPAVDTVTAADVQRLRSELAYMILADERRVGMKKQKLYEGQYLMTNS